MASNRLRPLAASAVEGAVLALAAGAASWALLGPGSRGRAAVGLGLAWGVSTASIALLALTRGGSFQTFLRGFGAGVGLRASVLVLLVAATWSEGWEGQAPLLSAYVLGTLGLFTLEVRHLRPEKRP
ncbi:hypothetical protein EPO15_07320 [bacterium]|nr:MAG: hypothetical protein EPO15_07320 [bacterium]